MLKRKSMKENADTLKFNYLFGRIFSVFGRNVIEIRQKERYTKVEYLGIFVGFLLLFEKETEQKNSMTIKGGSTKEKVVYKSKTKKELKK